jgi:hypothetical protein
MCLFNVCIKKFFSFYMLMLRVKFDCMTLDRIAVFQIIAGEKLDIHIIIDDPAGNSYLQVAYLVILICLSLSIYPPDDLFVFRIPSIYLTPLYFSLNVHFTLYIFL